MYVGTQEHTLEEEDVVQIIKKPGVTYPDGLVKTYWRFAIYLEFQTGSQRSGIIVQVNFHSLRYLIQVWGMRIVDQYIVDFSLTTVSWFVWLWGCNALFIGLLIERLVSIRMYTRALLYSFVVKCARESWLV